MFKFEFRDLAYAHTPICISLVELLQVPPLYILSIDLYRCICKYTQHVAMLKLEWLTFIIMTCNRFLLEDAQQFLTVLMR